MRRIFLILFFLGLLISSYGSDLQRKGVQFSGGLGFMGSLEAHRSGSEIVSPGLSDNCRLGYGLSEKCALNLAVRNQWIILSRFYHLGNYGIDFDYYFCIDRNSWYSQLGVSYARLTDFGNLISGPEIAFQGPGLVAGIGYRVATHFDVSASLNYTLLIGSEETDVDSQWDALNRRDNESAHFLMLQIGLSFPFY